MPRATKHCVNCDEAIASPAAAFAKDYCCEACEAEFRGEADPAALAAMAENAGNPELPLRSSVKTSGNLTPKNAATLLEMIRASAGEIQNGTVGENKTPEGQKKD